MTLRMRASLRMQSSTIVVGLTRLVQELFTNYNFS